MIFLMKYKMNNIRTNFLKIGFCQINYSLFMLRIPFRLRG